MGEHAGQIDPKDLIGKEIKFEDTENTQGKGIVGGPGVIESVSKDGIFQVIFTDKTFGPAGPYALTTEDFSVVEENQEEA